MQRPTRRALAKVFGKQIKLIRVENDLKQAEFAKSIGVAATRISKWELGQSLVNTEFLVRIAKKYGFSLARFDKACLEIERGNFGRDNDSKSISQDNQLAGTTTGNVG